MELVGKSSADFNYTRYESLAPELTAHYAVRYTDTFSALNLLLSNTSLSANCVFCVLAAILHFGEGAQRSVAIRRLCKYFRAEIIEDIMDPNKKTLVVVLLPPDKGFITDYQQVAASDPGEEIRPVGIPGVFFPLDTCGKALHRQGMSLPNRERSKPNKDYLVTVYTKSMLENAERGLVVKLYDRAISETAVLHIGASELIRICEHFDEPDLLKDLVLAQAEEDSLELDDIEKGFSELTAKGDLRRKTQSLINRLMEIVLGDLGYYISPQDTVVPYIRSGPRGIFPS
mgnify:CR=1 FL=1